MCKHSCTRRKTTRLHLSAATPKAFLHFGNYFFSFLFFSLFFPCCRPTVANLAISSDRCPFFFYFFFSFRYFYFFSVFASSRHNLHSRKLLVPRNLRNRAGLLNTQVLSSACPACDFRFNLVRNITPSYRISDPRAT